MVWSAPKAGPSAVIEAGVVGCAARSTGGCVAGCAEDGVAVGLPEGDCDWTAAGVLAVCVSNGLAGLPFVFCGLGRDAR